MCPMAFARQSLPLARNEIVLRRAITDVNIRTDSRFVPIQWKRVLLSNHVSHCLGEYD